MPKIPPNTISPMCSIHTHSVYRKGRNEKGIFFLLNTQIIEIRAKKINTLKENGTAKKIVFRRKEERRVEGCVCVLC